MTLEYIGAIIESVYYNGRVLTNDKKLDRDDFIQMARAANGDVMRSIWYEENQVGDPLLYFASSITTERFPIKKKGRYRVIEFEEGGVVKLPYAMGVLRISPAASETDEEDCEDDYDMEDVYHRGKPGMETTFGSQELLDDLDEAFYIPIGNGARLFGFADALFADADYIKNDEQLDIPDGPAWRIINLVLGPVLKVAGYPVDPTENNNPNVTTIKSALSGPQEI